MIMMMMMTRVIMLVMMTMIMMMTTDLVQVGPGDDYVLTVGRFNQALSTLGDSMISSYSSGNLMKFTTK